MKCLEKNPNFGNYPPPTQLRWGEYGTQRELLNLSVFLGDDSMYEIQYPKVLLATRGTLRDPFDKTLVHFATDGQTDN